MKSLTLVVLLTAAAAWADLVAPAEAECRGDKKQGDACRLELGAGVCAAATCTRNDYSGGVPPKRKSVPCLKCLPAEVVADAGASLPDAGAAAAPKKGKQ